MGPYRAMLRYYRCDAPYRAILFQEGWQLPEMVRCSPDAPPAPGFTQAHLCDTPFCNISCDSCAIPHLSRKWPRSLFRPVQARSWKERSGAEWDQDGPECGRAQDQTQARVWMAPPETVIGADFWEGDPTKHFSVKKKGFSVKRGEGFSERGVW